jgi:hypothetical protein
MWPLEPELEEEVMTVARRLGREKDPAYWKQKYFELLALNVKRKQERDLLLGMVLVSLLAAGGLLLMKWLFRW